MTSVDSSSDCKQSIDGQFSLSHLHECEVQVDKSVSRVTVLVQVAGRFIPNSDPEGTVFKGGPRGRVGKVAEFQCS